MGMGEEVPHGVGIFDDEHREFVSRVFERFPPGCCLLQGSSEEKRVSYFKMDKAIWLSFFMHDYTIASLRGDERAKDELEAVYREIAEALDWPDKEPTQVREELGELAWKAVEILFNFYREKLKVEGWRREDKETLRDGERRGLRTELSPVGDKFRAEYGRWIALQETLTKFEGEVRRKDRVALFMALEFDCMVRRYIEGMSWHHPYINYVLGSLVSGRQLDRWVDEAMWYAYKSLKRYEEQALNPYIRFMTESQDLIVRAAMAAEGIDPQNRTYEEVRSYLADLSARLGKPELLRLYNVSMWGTEDGTTPDIFLSAILEDSPTEEEKQFFEKMYKAGREFVGAMTKTVEDIIEKRYGYRVNLCEFEVEKEL
ncbi:MAG: hypothetical protein QW334_02360 [Thermofilum sp.]